MNASCRCAAILVIVALGFAACTTAPVRARSSLVPAEAKIDAALGSQPFSISTYNAALRELCLDLASRDPKELLLQLKNLGFLFVVPKIALPLKHIEISAPQRSAQGEAAGIPVVLEYDTKDAPSIRRKSFLSMHAFFTSAPPAKRDSSFEPDPAPSFLEVIGFSLRAIQSALGIG